MYLPQYDIWVVRAARREVQEVLRDWETYSSKAFPFHDPTSIRLEVLLTSDPGVHTRGAGLDPAGAVGARRCAGAFASPRRGGRAGGGAAHGAGPVELDGYKDLSARYVLQVFPDVIGMPQEHRQFLMEFGDSLGLRAAQRRLREKGVREGTEAMAHVERSCRRDAPTPDGIGAAISVGRRRGRSPGSRPSCSSRPCTRRARTRRSS